MKGKKSPWGKLSATDKKKIKQIASTGMVGGKSRGLKIPK